MKVETWIFAVCAIFFIVVAPAYWLVTSAGPTGADWTGTSALGMAALLTSMVALYLGFHARRMDARPEDRQDGEIIEGAGELGFFPPYSWWPLWCAMCFAVIILGTVIGWWLVIIGGAFGAMALSGWIFEYYRGVHAH